MIADDNLVMLTITAVNRGEGAYETELYALLPPEADYIGVERRVEVNTHAHSFTHIAHRFVWHQLSQFNVKGQKGGCWK